MKERIKALITFPKIDSLPRFTVPQHKSTKVNLAEVPQFLQDKKSVRQIRESSFQNCRQ